MAIPYPEIKSTALIRTQSTRGSGGVQTEGAGISGVTQLSEMDAELNRASGSVEHIEWLTSELIKRLKPVMRNPDEAGPATESSAEAPSSPLASSVRAVGSRIDIVAQRIDAILKHLAI